MCVWHLQNVQFREIWYPPSKLVVHVPRALLIELSNTLSLIEWV